MDTYEVQAVETVTNGQGTPVWLVSMLKPDGTIHCHAFPPSAIEWRMAEYGLDTVDEALDIVLHEPFAVSPQDHGRRLPDPAEKAGMVTRLPGRARDEPIHLHNAPTIAAAREAHRLRIADAKTRVQVKPPKGKSDPLDVIRRAGVTETGVRIKTALVDAARCGVRGEPVPADTLRVLDEITPAFMKAKKEAARA